MADIILSTFEDAEKSNPIGETFEFLRHPLRRKADHRRPGGGGTTTNGHMTLWMVLMELIMVHSGGLISLIRNLYEIYVSS